MVIVHLLPPSPRYPILSNVIASFEFHVFFRLVRKTFINDLSELCGVYPDVEFAFLVAEGVLAQVEQAGDSEYPREAVHKLER